MSLLDEFKNLNKVCQKPNYKTVGNWMVRNIIRQACVPMTYFLIKTPVTANQITLFSLILAVGAAVAFLAIDKLSFVWLALFLHLSYYFDHVDGQIARYKNQVSISGTMFDFITHHIIFGAIIISLGLKAYLNSADMFYLYCGIIGSFSIISFNLLEDSKYKAFFAYLQRQTPAVIKLVRRETAPTRKRDILAKAFSLLHKTCEMHIIINTITVIAVMQLAGVNGLVFYSLRINWAELLATYYAASSFILAAVKTFYLVTRKKPDKDFQETFLISR